MSIDQTTLAIYVTVCGVIALTTVQAAFGQQSFNQTTQQANNNFTQLFSEQLTGATCEYQLCSQYLTVVHESPSTLVLDGEQIAFTMRNEFVNNEVLWKGVDMLKQQGFTIDSVIMSGIGTIDNPHKYHIIMSRE